MINLMHKGQRSSIFSPIPEVSCENNDLFDIMKVIYIKIGNDIAVVQ